MQPSEFLFGTVGWASRPLCEYAAPMAEERTRIVAGCMTGTSLDGLDVALVKITGSGLGMKAELLGHLAEPMPNALRSELMSLASGEAREPIVSMRAARALGELHADCLAKLLAGGLVPPSASPIDFVTAHGQTIWHAPRDAREQPGGGPKSWQLFDPWPIVRRLKLPVCYDLRQADLIAGGEGAPLTPIADWVMYRAFADLVLNLGGVCNGTLLDHDLTEIKGRDIGPCNLLLDGLCQHLFGTAYDRDGQIASAGEINGSAQQIIFKHPRCNHGVFEGSLGREDFGKAWLEGIAAESAEVCGKEDLLASAADAIAGMIDDWWPCEPESRVVLAGGGSRHRYLVARIRERVGCKDVLLSDDVSIPCEAREAMGWAVLGALSQDGVPVSLPQVTGAKAPGVAGVWAYP